jgi:hypothetical protein
MRRNKLVAVALATALVLSAAAALASPANVRLSNDYPGGGYVSAYTLATGISYTDAVLSECSIARGRQNEPSAAVDPRDTRVLIGSSNDYCGVYAGSTPGNFVAAGPIWLGYYRSQNSGASFQSSLVPGYPGDTSPYAALAKIRTASSGDPVIAWDNHGRVFMGSESSDDPAGSAKTFGDVWVASYVNPNGSGGAAIDDGKQYVGTVRVAKGSSAPALLGVFHDKTSIEADRTGGPFDGNVYFAWARFTGGKISNIYFSRSTDHGVTFSTPMNITPSNGNLQDPEISITGNGNVYVTFDTFAMNNGQPFGLYVAKSTNGGATFSSPRLITTYRPVDVQDVYVTGGSARDCGDQSNACQSGYTFFRQATSLRATADQYDTTHQWVYLVYGATKPGSEVNTGTTFGEEAPGVGGQEIAYFVRYNGATGTHTTPKPISDKSVGHQVFPDISADGGMLHAIWWDSRNDPNYSAARPIGNDANGVTGPSLDVYASNSTDFGVNWAASTRLTNFTSNPNFEQFSNRTVPFAGDYLWVTSMGAFSYATWTDWRNTTAGTDPREGGAEDNDAADVLQCRTFSGGVWGGDQCPRDGGLDQDIYGAVSP